MVRNRIKQLVVFLVILCMFIGMLPLNIFASEKYRYYRSLYTNKGTVRAAPHIWDTDNDLSTLKFKINFKIKNSDSTYLELKSNVASNVNYDNELYFSYTGDSSVDSDGNGCENCVSDDHKDFGRDLTPSEYLNFYYALKSLDFDNTYDIKFNSVDPDTNIVDVDFTIDYYDIQFNNPDDAEGILSGLLNRYKRNGVKPSTIDDIDYRLPYIFHDFYTINTNYFEISLTRTDYNLLSCYHEELQVDLNKEIILQPFIETYVETDDIYMNDNGSLISCKDVLNISDLSVKPNSNTDLQIDMEQLDNIDYSNYFYFDSKSGLNVFFKFDCSDGTYQIPIYYCSDYNCDLNHASTHVRHCNCVYLKYDSTVNKFKIILDDVYIPDRSDKLNITYSDYTKTPLEVGSILHKENNYLLNYFKADSGTYTNYTDSPYFQIYNPYSDDPYSVGGDFSICIYKDGVESTTNNLEHNSCSADAYNFSFYDETKDYIVTSIEWDGTRPSSSSTKIYLTSYDSTKDVLFVNYYTKELISSCTKTNILAPTNCSIFLDDAKNKIDDLNSYITNSSSDIIRIYCIPNETSFQAYSTLIDSSGNYIPIGSVPASIDVTTLELEGNTFKNVKYEVNSEVTDNFIYNDIKYNDWCYVEGKRFDYISSYDFKPVLSNTRITYGSFLFASPNCIDFFDYYSDEFITRVVKDNIVLPDNYGIFLYEGGKVIDIDDMRHLSGYSRVYCIPNSIELGVYDGTKYIGSNIKLDNVKIKCTLLKDTIELDSDNDFKDVKWKTEDLGKVYRNGKIYDKWFWVDKNGNIVDDSVSSSISIYKRDKLFAYGRNSNDDLCENGSVTYNLGVGYKDSICSKKTYQDAINYHSFVNEFYISLDEYTLVHVTSNSNPINSSNTKLISLHNSYYEYHNWNNFYSSIYIWIDTDNKKFCIARHYEWAGVRYYLNLIDAKIYQERYVASSKTIDSKLAENDTVFNFISYDKVNNRLIIKKQDTDNANNFAFESFYHHYSTEYDYDDPNMDLFSMSAVGPYEETIDNNTIGVGHDFSIDDTETWLDVTSSVSNQSELDTLINNAYNKDDFSTINFSDVKYIKKLICRRDASKCISNRPYILDIKLKEINVTVQNYFDSTVKDIITLTDTYPNILQSDLSNTYSRYYDDNLNDLGSDIESLSFTESKTIYGIPSNQTIDLKSGTTLNKIGDIQINYSSSIKDGSTNLQVSYKLASDLKDISFNEEKYDYWVKVDNSESDNYKFVDTSTDLSYNDVLYCMPLESTTEHCVSYGEKIYKATGLSTLCGGNIPTKTVTKPSLGGHDFTGVSYVTITKPTNLDDLNSLINNAVQVNGSEDKTSYASITLDSVKSIKKQECTRTLNICTTPKGYNLEIVFYGNNLPKIENISDTTPTLVTDNSVVVGDLKIKSSDEDDDLVKVTIDGVDYTPDMNNEVIKTIIADNQAHTIKAVDASNNITTVTVTVNIPTTPPTPISHNPIIKDVGISPNVEITDNYESIGDLKLRATDEDGDLKQLVVKDKDTDTIIVTLSQDSDNKIEYTVFEDTVIKEYVIEAEDDDGNKTTLNVKVIPLSSFKITIQGYMKNTENIAIPNADISLDMDNLSESQSEEGSLFSIFSMLPLAKFNLMNVGSTKQTDADGYFKFENVSLDNHVLSASVGASSAYKMQIDLTDKSKVKALISESNLGNFSVSSNSVITASSIVFTVNAKECDNHIHSHKYGQETDSKCAEAGYLEVIDYCPTCGTEWSRTKNWKSVLGHWFEDDWVKVATVTDALINGAENTITYNGVDDVYIRTCHRPVSNCLGSENAYELKTVSSATPPTPTPTPTPTPIPTPTPTPTPNPTPEPEPIPQPSPEPEPNPDDIEEPKEEDNLGEEEVDKEESSDDVEDEELDEDVDEEEPSDDVEDDDLDEDIIEDGKSKTGDYGIIVLFIGMLFMIVSRVIKKKK